jgi:hypothetical protein
MSLSGGTTRSCGYALVASNLPSRWSGRHRRRVLPVVSDFAGIPEIPDTADEARPHGFAAKFNHRRYHESIDNLTPADVYCGRGSTILAERQRIKRQTIANRRLQHRLQAA